MGPVSVALLPAGVHLRNPRAALSLIPVKVGAGVGSEERIDAPNAIRLRNVGEAREDSDCLLAPSWQLRYQRKTAEIVREP